MILRGLNQCGWLGFDFRTGRPLPSDGITTCPQTGVEPADRPDRINFMSSVNCHRCDTGYDKYLQAADVPTDDRLGRPSEIPACLNLDKPLLSFGAYPSAARPRFCRNRIPKRITKSTISAAGGSYKIRWRYVTRGSRKWVMVQDDEIPESRRGEGIWYFVPRQALGPKPLCPRNTGSIAGDRNCVNENTNADRGDADSRFGGSRAADRLRRRRRAAVGQRVQHQRSYYPDRRQASGIRASRRH